MACLGRAIEDARVTLSEVMEKARLWEALTGIDLNDRQRFVLNRMLDGLEGNLTTTNYGKLAQCSHDTWLRDIHQLLEKGMLVRNSKGGRSTSYMLAGFPTRRQKTNRKHI